MSCRHERLDPQNSRICLDCGEVLDRRSYESLESWSPSDQSRDSFPFLNDNGRALLQLYAKIETICDQCALQANIHLSVAVRRHVTDLVTAYKYAVSPSIVHSFEDIIRTAILVYVRSSEYSVPVSKIIPRFDGKRAPAFRILSKINEILGTRAPSLTPHSLILHIAETILNHLKDKGIYPGRLIGFAAKADVTDDVVLQSTRLMRLLSDNGRFPEVPRFSQALACVYIVVRFGSEYHRTLKPRDLSLTACISLLSMDEENQSVFKAFELARRFLKQALTEVGIRGKSESLAFTNLDSIETKYSAKAHLSKRLKVITES